MHHPSSNQQPEPETEPSVPQSDPSMTLAWVCIILTILALTGLQVLDIVQQSTRYPL